MTKKRIERRWLLMADTHCGATTGLTSRPDNQIQEQVLNRYRDAIKWYGDSPDVTVLVGDGQDGSDPKSKDLTEHDLFEQARRCAEILEMTQATSEYIYVTGTGYHKDDIDFERHTLEVLEKSTGKKCTFARKLNTSINGWFRLEARHKIGSSQIPHGRKTAPERHKFWNVINAALSSRSDSKAAAWPDLCVFAHTHYYSYAEDAFGASMILPSWLAIGSRYGDEQCSGHVDLGMAKLTVGAEEADGWRAEKRLYQAAVIDRSESR